MSNSIYPWIVSVCSKKACMLLGCFMSSNMNLYDVGIVYTAFQRSVELYSAGRLLLFSQKIFKKGGFGEQKTPPPVWY